MDEVMAMEGFLGLQVGFVVFPYWAIDVMRTTLHAVTLKDISLVLFASATAAAIPTS